MFRFIRLIVTATLVACLFGCATKQKGVELSDGFWQNKHQTVTVATTKAPKPHLYKTGNQGGVPGRAVSEVMNIKLDHYLKTVGETWYETALPEHFVTRLKQRDINAKLASGSFTQVGSDKLLLIKLDAYGVKRRYHGLIPAEAPQAYCVLTGELLDKNHKVLWRHQSIATQPIQGEWDQPPNYPNLTDALRVAAHSAEQELLDSFFAG